MMVFLKIIVYLSTIILMFTIVPTTFAVENPIDWSKGVIRVTGQGVGKSQYKSTSPGQYRLTGIQAARMDAQRQLVSYIEGIQVTAESSMAEFALKYDTVKTQTAGLIKNAVEIGEPKYNSENDTWEVVMEMKLYGGPKSVASVAFIPLKDEPRISFPKPVNKNIITEPTVVNQNYTGLIVDCSGLGELNPVMSPVIKNTDGTKIYGHQNLDPDKIVVNGMASYADSVDDPINQSRAGNKPLIIKAVSLSDLNATPVVSIEDADKILAANQSDKFLDNCAVVFVK